MPINRDDKTVRKDRRCDKDGDDAGRERQARRLCLSLFFVATGAAERDRVDRASIPARLSGRFSDCVHRPSSRLADSSPAEVAAGSARADHGRAAGHLRRPRGARVGGQDPRAGAANADGAGGEETVRWRETARREGRVDRAEAVSRNGV